MKKILLALALLFSTLSLPAFAGDSQPLPAPPPMVVTGNEHPVDIGELIDLKISIQGTPPANMVGVNYIWMRVDNNDIIEDFKHVTIDGSEIHSGTGKFKRTLTFIVVPIFKYKIGNDIQVQESKEIKVLVQVDDIRPPSPPSPPEPPKPNLPDGRFAISQSIAENLLADTDISNSDKVNLAIGLSATFKDIASHINNDKTYGNFNAIYKDTVDAIKLSLANKNVNLASTAKFEKYLSALMYDCYKNKGMTSASALGEAWSEAVIGFDWIANNIK